MLIVGIMFWVAVVAAFFDWRYVRAGGVRPTRDEYRYLGYAVGLCVIALVGLALYGARAEGLGAMTALVFPLIFILWEWRRYRTRRTHPAPSRKAPE